VIDERSSPRRCRDPERHGYEHRDEHCGQGKLEGRWKPLCNLVGDGCSGAQ
jgi:hypothetical protein